MTTIANPTLTIVNEHLQFKKVDLVEPTTTFYIQLAAEVDHSITPFFITTSSKKKKLIALCKKCCRQIQELNGVKGAVVFKARLIPPGRGKFLEQRKDKLRISKFDVAVLIEVNDQESVAEIMKTKAFQEMEHAIKDAAYHFHKITATNIRRIESVDHSKQGVFLFNYFFADSTQQNLEVWEYTAGWFQQETGLDNSTVLLPLDEKTSDYAIVNHCRWDSMWDILPSLLFKKSFHSYVLENFEANNVAAIPVLYKMA